MPIVAGAGGREDNSSSAIAAAEQMRLRRPRNQMSSSTSRDPSLQPHIPSITQSTRCKSTISSLFLSTFSHNSDGTNTQTRNSSSSSQQTQTNSDNKKKNFKNSTLRGLGCTAHPEVTVPAVIRSSADWEGNREKTKKKDDVAGNSSKSRKEEKKNKKKKKGQKQQQQQSLMEGSGVQELWCGPGIAGGFTTDAASVDCVVSTTRPLSGRGKIDIDKAHHHREHHSCSSRQRTNPDQFADVDFDSAFEFPHIGADVFEARYHYHHHHHLRNRSPEGLAEIMMFRNSLLLGRRSDGFDRYGDWRLDVDNMSYEELLELGDRIGYVSTGLGEDQIGRCIRKIKATLLDDLSTHLQVEMDGKCSICQEEYEAEDEMGKLECGHAYHMHCIQQWLVKKNACPVCKVEASSK